MDFKQRFENLGGQMAKLLDEIRDKNETLSLELPNLEFKVAAMRKELKKLEEQYLDANEKLSTALRKKVRIEVAVADLIKEKKAEAEQIIEAANKAASDTLLDANKRDQEITEREKKIAERDYLLTEKIKSFERKSTKLEERITEIDSKEAEVKDLQKSVDAKEKELFDREKDIVEQKSKLEAEKRDIAEVRSKAEKQAAEIAKKDEELTEKLYTVDLAKKKVDLAKKNVETIAVAQQRKSKQLEGREVRIRDREATLKTNLSL